MKDNDFFCAPIDLLLRVCDPYRPNGQSEARIELRRMLIDTPETEPACPVRFADLPAETPVDDKSHPRFIAGYTAGLHDHKLGQPQGEPVTIEAVAVTRDNGDGSLRLEWLLEGGIANMEFAGMVLFAIPEANALDHIAKTCRQSRQSTRRIRWIEARANCALEGKPYDAKLLDLPLEVDRELDRLKRRHKEHLERIWDLERALGGMLFAFDDGVGRDWSENLLDFARRLIPAAEFKSDAELIEEGVADADAGRLKPLGEVKARHAGAHLAALLESLAKQVYQSWESQPGFVPWVEGGNSTKQEEARQIASRTFELALANQVGD